MKVLGIVAEYNPFHNGHAYQIEKAKKETNADYAIAVISGNYVQRGTPAIVNKYDRSFLALKGGIDLIIELPVIYACASAEYFASAAVLLLESLGVVDILCFGSELGSLSLFQKLADILLDEPVSLQATIQSLLKTGINYPTARCLALEEYFKDSIDSSLLHNILAQPNNILSIEYIKAIQKFNCSLHPYTIRRTAASYHDLSCDGNICSATALRSALYRKDCHPFDLSGLTVNGRHLFQQLLGWCAPIHEDDFSLLLQYKLLSEKNFNSYLDISSDLSDRILHTFRPDDTFSSLSARLKTRQLTQTRVNRCLLHILLNIHTDEMQQYQENGWIFYARILGFRKESAPLLAAIRKNSSIPVINKVSAAKRKLTPIGYTMFKHDLFASHLYNQIVYHRFQTLAKDEYRYGILIV